LAAKKTTRRQAVRTALARWAKRPLEVVTDVPDRAMVIFAHPDDAEIGSGGVIAKWIAAGCEVTYVLCTTGSAGTADRSLTPDQLVDKRAAEQRAAADFMGVKNLVMLRYPDGGLEDTREFRGDVVRAIRAYRPHTVFAHDPYRIRGFQHRDHRAVGIVATDAVYPFARDHLHFPEHIVDEGLEPHKVRELWYWGPDQPDVIVDVSASIDKQIAALIRHESQMPGFNVAEGETIGQRVKKNAASLARGYRFRYGAAFRRLVARR
jgi:LmbE family N-acetylglucosaminyl deacetylase